MPVCTTAARILGKKQFFSCSQQPPLLSTNLVSRDFRRNASCMVTAKTLNKWATSFSSEMFLHLTGKPYTGWGHPSCPSHPPTPHQTCHYPAQVFHILELHPISLPWKMTPTPSYVLEQSLNWWSVTVLVSHTSQKVETIRVYGSVYLRQIAFQGSKKVVKCPKKTTENHRHFKKSGTKGPHEVSDAQHRLKPTSHRPFSSWALTYRQ